MYSCTSHVLLYIICTLVHHMYLYLVLTLHTRCMNVEYLCEYHGTLAYSISTDYSVRGLLVLFTYFLSLLVPTSAYQGYLHTSVGLICFLQYQYVSHSTSMSLIILVCVLQYQYRSYIVLVCLLQYQYGSCGTSICPYYQYSTTVPSTKYQTYSCYLQHTSAIVVLYRLSTCSSTPRPVHSTVYSSTRVLESCLEHEINAGPRY